MKVSTELLVSYWVIGEAEVMVSAVELLATLGELSGELTELVDKACCVSICLLRSTFLWKALAQRVQAKGL